MAPLLNSPKATAAITSTSTSTSTPTSTAVVHEATQFSALPTDIIQSHILTHLDGPSLASATCCSASLHRLSSQYHLWSQLCHATWPSTAAASFMEVISTFPDCGPCTFFAQSYPLPVMDPTIFKSSNRTRLSPLTGLISAVDIKYKDELIFSKIQETETMSKWFRCSPCRIDLLDQKDVVPTRIKQPESEITCFDVAADMNLSWIIVNPTGRRAVNLSSYKPVSVQRHWLSGEMQVRFSSILSGAGKNTPVQCLITVTCGRSDGGEMQLREVSLQMEDMDNTHLDGKDVMVILQKALEGKRGNALNRVEEGRKRYIQYLEMKQERKEKKERVEESLDTMCVALGICCFVAFCGFLWCKM